MLLDYVTQTQPWGSLTPEAAAAANSDNMWIRMRTLCGISDYTRQLMSLIGHSGYVTSVCMSPDGSKIVSGSGDKTVKVWDAATGQRITTLEGHSSWLNSVCMSPEGTKIVGSAHDKTVKVGCGHGPVKYWSGLCLRD